MNRLCRLRLLIIGLIGIIPISGNCSQAVDRDDSEILYRSVMLDPDHVKITPPDQINWTGKEGEQKALLFGNPERPGTYAMLIRWSPGHFSKPHFHSRDRMVYVISGKWWMSSNEHYDPKQTVPIAAESFVVQKAGTVHWDGALDQPCELLLIGEGPVKTTWLNKPQH